MRLHAQRARAAGEPPPLVQQKRLAVSHQTVAQPVGADYAGGAAGRNVLDDPACGPFRKPLHQPP